MALNFPASPSTGDVHQASNNLSYFFDGVKWITQGSYNTGTINALKLDSLTSSFNGTLKTFNLTVDNKTIKPANAQSLIISLAGVILEPVTAYTINSVQGTITFTSAPASSTAFFGVVYSRLPIETTLTNVSDGVITDIKIAGDAAIALSKLATGALPTAITVTSANISDLSIVDADISSSAAISLSKLATGALPTAITVTSANISDLSIVNADVNGSAAIEGSKLQASSGSNSGTMSAADFTKLAGIETGATANQTDEEIQDIVGAMVSGNTESGISVTYQDSDGTLDFSVDSQTDNNFTTTLKNKLDGIEASATADQTASEIKTLLQSNKLTASEIADSAITTAKIADGTIVTADIADDAITTAKIAANAITASRIVDGTIQESKINNGAVTVHKIATNAVNSFKIVDGAVTSAKILDGTIVGSDLATNVDLVDNQKLRLGTGNDLQIYHDGTDSYIANANGALIITQHNNDIHLRPKTAEEGIVINNDASVDLYYNGSKKFETTSSGVTITGSVNMGSGDILGSGNLNLEDNGKIKLGTSDDLKIYHNGSHSYIEESGTGNLYIRSSNTRIQSPAGEDQILIEENGSVELFEDGVKKAETTSDGFNVEGTLHANGLDMDDNHKILLGLGDDLEIYHDSEHSYIKNATNQLRIESLDQIRLNTNNFNVYKGNLTEFTFRAVGDGSTYLYYDGAIKAETLSTGVSVTGNINLDAELNLVGGSDAARFIDSQVGDGNALHFRRVSGGDAGHQDMAKFHGNGSCELYHANSKKIETTSSGVTVTGTVTETSDIALKSDIQPITNTLEKIQQITGYKYNLINSISPSMGVIAQDVEKVFPELVHGSEGNKTLQYSGLIGVLVEAVKDLSAKVAALETA